MFYAGMWIHRYSHSTHRFHRFNLCKMEQDFRHRRDHRNSRLHVVDSIVLSVLSVVNHFEKINFIIVLRLHDFHFLHEHITNLLEYSTKIAITIFESLLHRPYLPWIILIQLDINLLLDLHLLWNVTKMNISLRQLIRTSTNYI